MKLIVERKGKKKGKRDGVTVNVYKQYVRPIKSKSLTVHGFSVEETHAWIRFFLRALQMSKSKKITIIVEE